MPLRDHFRPPMTDVIGWTSVHGAWAAVLAFDLNRLLPAGYYAAPLTKFGIEIDVAALDVRRNGSQPVTGFSSDWPTAPTQTLVRQATLTDEVGVRIYAGGPRRMLVGAIELVSPANKDRAESRNAFLNKGMDVLRSGAGLIVVDVVTERHFNLHRALVERWGGPQEPPFGADLYATAYRPILPQRSEDNEDIDEVPPRLDIWAEALTVGRALPTLPLWLLDVGPVGVDLEATYEQTLRGLRF